MALVVFVLAGPAEKIIGVYSGSAGVLNGITEMQYPERHSLVESWVETHLKVVLSGTNPDVI